MSQAPPPPAPAQPTAQDAEHLNLLAVFHYVLGGLNLLMGCCPSIYLVLGLLMLLGVGEFGQGQVRATPVHVQAMPEFPHVEPPSPFTPTTPAPPAPSGMPQAHPPAQHGNPPLVPAQHADVMMARMMGLIITLVALALMLGIWIFGALTIYAGRCLHTRRRYTFCFVIAVIQCLSFPLGTALGVFTLIVLMRPSVKTMFGVQTT